MGGAVLDVERVAAMEAGSGLLSVLVDAIALVVREFCLTLGLPDISMIELQGLRLEAGSRRCVGVVGFGVVVLEEVMFYVAMA